jgi:hypothetical protein
VIQQTYPLFAIDQDGTAYAVIGWVEATAARRYQPVLAPMSKTGRVELHLSPAADTLNYSATEPAAIFSIPGPDPDATAVLQRPAYLR